MKIVYAFLLFAIVAIPMAVIATAVFTSPIAGIFVIVIIGAIVSEETYNDIMG